MSSTTLKCFVAALALAFAGSAGAVTIERWTLTEACTRSTQVVEVRVLSARVERGAEGWLWTVHELEVLDGLKGARRGERLLMHRAGGELDGMRMEIAGLPGFAVGDEALLFLNRDRSGRLRVANATQGDLRLPTATGLERRAPQALMQFPSLRSAELAAIKASVRGRLGAQP
jgi:hypothetical protein